MKTTDENIDKLLKAMCNFYPARFPVGEYCKSELGLVDLEYYAYVQRLNFEGLADPGDPEQLMLITPLGTSIVKAGGYLKYSKEKRDEALRIEEDKRIEREQNKYQLRLTKNRVRYFYVFFALAVLGFITGIISLVMQLTRK